MADREVGLKFVVRDGASKGIKGIGVTAAVARKSVASLSEGLTKSLTAGAVGFVALESAIGIASRVMGAFDFLVRDTIQALADVQGEGSSAAIAFANLERSLKATRAEIGAVMLPVLQGFIAALDDAGGGVAGLIKANREMLSVKVAEFFAGILSVAARLAPVFGIMAKSVLGLVLAFGSLRLAAEVTASFISSAFVGVGPAVSAAKSNIAEIEAGMDRTARQIESLDRGIASMSESLDGLANGGLKNAIAKIEEFRGASAKAKSETFDFGAEFGKGFSIGAQGEELISLVDRYSTAIEERAAVSASRRNRTEFEISEFRLSLYRKDEAAFIASQRAKETEAQAVATQIGDAFGAAIGGMIAGTQTFEQAFRGVLGSLLQLFLSNAIKQININAAVGATEGIKAHAGIPFVGVALGAAAAATISALIMSFLSKFAQGGEVRGGIPGRDSVLALLTPDERVLSVAENRQSKSMDNGHASTTIINIDAGDTAGLLSSTQRKRYLLRLAKDIESMQRDGLLRIGMARA